jgi:translation elongation factor P/translation initiation factor 5A
MRKKAKDLKKGDKVTITGKKYIVEEVEISDIGKQGTKKCRLVLRDEKGDKSVIIRPEDYPFDAS